MQNPSSSNKRKIVGGRHLWRDRSGVVAIIVALVSPVIFGTAALAVDVGRLVFLESQLQTAADAAALAAATSFNDAATAQSLAQEYAGKNMPSSEFGTVVQTSDVVLGNFDQSTGTFTANGTPTNAVQVTENLTAANGNPVSVYFAQLIGIDTRDVQTSALATEGSGGNTCILSLEPSDAGAIQVSGTVNLVDRFRRFDPFPGGHY